jgi:predicted AlkP superfamily pyrophosphatase or phosphodiesterase
VPIDGVGGLPAAAGQFPQVSGIRRRPGFGGTIRESIKAETMFKIAACIALLFVSGCAPRYVVSPPLSVAERVQPETSVTRHVLLVSIDGLRPDAIEVYRAPTLQRMIREGSYTLSASTIMPSKTLPSHTSMLTGQPPERHNVLWNNVATAKADLVASPTVFGVARARGYTTAAFFSKSKFNALQRPGTLDYSQAPGGWFGRWSSDRTVTDVEAHLATARPNVLFVHLTDPDRAGHDNGWMSDDYGLAVAATDAAMARLLAAAERAYGAKHFSVIVTADHGGHGRDHGSDDPQDVTIPWIAWGRGVESGRHLVDATVRTMDTAATMLWLLGIPEPDDWFGTPVVAAFSPPEPVAAVPLD